MASALANGITIEYETHGVATDEPLLLVMGLGAQLVAWPPGFIDALVAERFFVIAFDNRDIGLSTKFTMEPPSMRRLIAGTIAKRFVESEYLLADMANDAVGLLDALGIERAHVVGLSMGGMIAQTIAIDHPARIMSLCSIMSTTGNRRVGQIAPSLLPKVAKFSEGPKEEALERGVEGARLISGTSFDEFETRRALELALRRDYTPAGMARQLAAINASPDRTEALQNVRVPTLVIHGIADPLVRMSGGVATASAIPGSRLILFPEMGHNVPTARFGEVAAAIALNASPVRSKDIAALPVG